MNQPQQKVEKAFTSSVSAEDFADPAVQKVPESGAVAAASSALALQSNSVLGERHGAIKMLIAFASACAGTWGFGTLLYAQVL